MFDEVLFQSLVAIRSSFQNHLPFFSCVKIDQVSEGRPNRAINLRTSGKARFNSGSGKLYPRLLARCHRRDLPHVSHHRRTSEGSWQVG